MELTGKIIHAMETRSGVSARTGNPWASKDYVLEIPGNYPKRMVFTVFGEDRIKQFALRKDEEVIVQFDIDANEHQGKWYNKIQAYNILRVQQTGQVQQHTPAPQQAGTQPFPPLQPEQGGGSADDLPFWSIKAVPSQTRLSQWGYYGLDSWLKARDRAGSHTLKWQNN